MTYGSWASGEIRHGPALELAVQQAGAEPHSHAAADQLVTDGRLVFSGDRPPKRNDDEEDARKLHELLRQWNIRPDDPGVPPDLIVRVLRILRAPLSPETPPKHDDTSGSDPDKP